MSKFTLTLTAGLTAAALAMTPALAGNGNGGGNGGGSSKSASAKSSAKSVKASKSTGPSMADANKGGQRGAFAREFKSLNAVNANPNALANASPNSMPGKLYIYQQSGGVTPEDISALNAAAAQMQKLLDMDEAALLAAYDADGDGILSVEERAPYDEAVAAATGSYEALQEEGREAFEALAALHKADEEMRLTESGLRELNRLLGL